MRRASRIALIVIALGALFCACSGAPDIATTTGTSGPAAGQEQLPTAGNGITDVGTPVEEPDVPAGGSEDCSYASGRHGVLLVCPDGWRITELDEAHVRFASDAGVDLELSFIDLKEGETLQTFLEQVRGGSEGLDHSEKPGFDESLCAPEEAVDDEAGLFTVECYRAGRYEGLRFVLVESGIADQELNLIRVGQIPWDMATPESLARSSGIIGAVTPVRNDLVLQKRVFLK